MNTKAKKKPKVSRETIVKIIGYGLITAFLTIIIVMGTTEDASVNEDVSGFNGMVEEMHDIKKPEDIMHRYYKYLRGDSITDYTMTVEKQPRNRFMIVAIRENLNDPSTAAEKFRMLVEDEKNHWKVVMVERNWRCNEGKGDTDWGIGMCN